MREEKRKVTIAEGPLLRVLLPESPYQMWVDGELHDYLHVPHDGTRVEIIDGEIVVSPAPRPMHNLIAQQIADAIAFRRFNEPSYRWRCVQNSALNFIAEENGYIPDLLIVDVDVADTVWQFNPANLVTDQAELVLEVTSPATARRDRPPAKAATAGKGKWCGYARAEIPYYLLVDLDPKVAQATLYSIPDPATGSYLHADSWAFGETIVLPDPIALEIPTDRWKPWE
ncbi:Uma2 family endonuclease [Thermoactinospora rubra]|uniref:Uma2 family endonuclease n=1 Tax=Thermoactinospora rubra TaxID=1088767 RepID=UPI000A1174AE|nr:Uma2 family endonuclease [Thermoactinospora rubra]